MKALMGFAALLISTSTAAFGADTHSTVLVKELPLQSFFHTRHAWTAQIYQPVGEDADMGDEPVKICFVESTAAPSKNRNCTALIGQPAGHDVRPYPLQTLDGAELKNLPTGFSHQTRPALIVKATFFGGGSGLLRATFVWTDLRFPNGNDSFELAFQSVVTNAGQQEFISTGPLAGYFVSVDQVRFGDEANLAEPAHYEMDVYEPAIYGYIKVLSVISKERYPSNHTGEGLPDALKVLTPEIAHALKAAYPAGVPKPRGS